jgi:tRNA U34 5-methylaminomethyl-2-thiouridine-forming methyltransferase MnmC
MTITLMTMSDASAKSPSMASFRAGGLVRAAEASQSPPARPRKSHWFKRVCRRASAEYQVDSTEERLKNAPEAQ